MLTLQLRWSSSVYLAADLGKQRAVSGRGGTLFLQVREVAKFNNLLILLLDIRYWLINIAKLFLEKKYGQEQNTLFSQLAL